MKRKLIRIATLFLLLSAVCIPVFANSPPGGDPGGGFIAFLLYFFIVFGSLMITLATESLLSLCFPGCGKHTGKVLLANLCSQILMHAAYGTMVGFFTNRVPLIVALEAFVYCGEYLFYRKRMKDVSKKEILIFTLSANTLSLLAGLLTYRVIWM
jgi:hypothetical protein